MINTIAFILAAGKSIRWNEHLGICKHLVDIGGEVLICRSVRLLLENGITSIYIVSHDDRLKIDDRTTFLKTQSYDSIISTVLSTEKLWSEKCIFLLGDVFFTKSAMKKITNSKEGIAFFGRPVPSRITKARWPEIFGFSVQGEDKNKLRIHANAILQEANKGEVKLWQLYRSICGFLLYPIDLYTFERKIFCSINDFTDDFDFPEDYHKFILRYSRAKSTSFLKRYFFIYWVYFENFMFYPWYLSRRFLIKMLVYSNLLDSLKKLLISLKLYKNPFNK